MFRKVLTWVLILQHLNVYVLQAAPGKISVLFEPEKQDSSKYSLKIFKETEHKKRDEIHRGIYKFENSRFIPESEVQPNFPKEFRVKSGKGLHLKSILPSNEFSIHLYESGDALLQKLHSSNNSACMELETFGNILIDKPTKKVHDASINAKSLSLTGTHLCNRLALFADKLNLTAKAPLGTITNDTEGHIKIRKEAHVKLGTFKNHGRIEGNSAENDKKSFLYLHNNDFFNEFTGQVKNNDFKANIFWNGAFSILNVGEFVNKSPIIPQSASFDKNGVYERGNGKKDALFISARTLKNMDNIRGDDIVIACSEDLVNDTQGQIIATQDLELRVDGLLTNSGHIKAPRLLKINGKDCLFNKNGGLIEGDRAGILIRELKNEGFINTRLFSLVTEKLENFSKIKITKRGVIKESRGGQGLLNGKGGSIISDGLLKIIGNVLNNQSGNSNVAGDPQQTDLGIKANTLILKLNQAKNDGDILAEQKADIHISTLLNSESGIWRLPKDNNVVSDKLSNKDYIMGKALKMVVGVFENLGQIYSSTDFVLEVSQLFKNAKGAIISSVTGLNITGKGEVLNEGTLDSKDIIKIQSDKVSNTGRIISAKEVEIYTKESEGIREGDANDFENKGSITSPKITIQTQKGSNEKEGFIVGDSLTFVTDLFFINRGDIIGGTAINLEGNGLFENRKRIKSKGKFISRVSDFENKGLISANTGEMEGVTFENQGRINFHEDSTLKFDDILNDTKGFVGSEKKLTIDFQSVENKGKIKAKELIGHAFKNKATVLDANDNSASEEAEDSTFVNKGIFQGAHKVEVKADVAENESEVSSGGDILFKVSKVFKNAKDALISSIKELTIESDGEVQNTGHIGSQDKVKVVAAKAVNKGQIISEKEIEIDTKNKEGTTPYKEDFENEGLVLSPHIKLITKNGSSKGAINDEINLDKVDELKGLIAKQSLTLTIEDKFTNTGHMVGRASVNLEGKGTFVNEGMINKSDAFISHLTGVENKGTIRAYKTITLDKLTKELINSGLILSEGNLDITSQANISNSGIIEGRDGDVEVTAHRLDNNGTLSSFGKMLKIDLAEGENTKSIFGRETSISVSGKFDNQKSITTTKNLLLTATEYENSGQTVVGEKLIASLTTLKNDYRITAQSADIQAKDLQNSKDILIEEDLLLVTTRGSNTGKIQAKTSTLDLKKEKPEDFFGNKGALHANQSFILQGQGTLVNDGDLLSEGTLDLKNKSLQNNAYIQAEGKIDIANDTEVNNVLNAKIISKGPIAAGETATIKNEGLISSLDKITLNQKSFINEGRLEAKDDILLPNCHTLANQKNGHIFSAKGGVLLPNVQSVENDGIVSSNRSVSLLNRSNFKNRGVFQSNEIFIVTSKDLENHGRIVGRMGVGLGASGSLVTGKSARVESADGNVTLTAPQMNLKGEVIGQNIKVTSTEKSFSDSDVKMTPLKTLTLDVPHGWDLEGSQRKFAHNVEVVGPIFNAGHLHMNENFKWETSKSLNNKFDILVKGFLELTFNGDWTNLARVQAEKGSLIKAKSFLNKGTFYSYGKTTFICEEGFNNYWQMEVHGDCSIQAKTRSITNHSDAQFKQRNITNTDQTSNSNIQNIVNFQAENGSVLNHNAVMLIEGDSAIKAKAFLNKAADPTWRDIPPPEPIFVGKRGKGIRPKKRITPGQVPERRQVPAYRKDGGAGALFEAKNISILADTLENYGSKISAFGNFLFNGKTLNNKTLAFYESGTRHELIGYDGHRKNGKPKGRITNYYWDTKPYTDPMKDPTPFPALIKSKGRMDLNAQARNDTGTIQGQQVNLTGDKLENLKLTGLDHVSKQIPQFMSVASYFDESKLEGPSFWKVDTQKETDFQINLNKPDHFLSKENIEGQIHKKPETNLNAHTEALNIFAQGIKEKMAQFFGSEKKENTDSSSMVTKDSSGFWDPTPGDLRTYEKSLTPSSLNQVPPRIALVDSPDLKGGGRMQYHPALLAELVTKTLLDTTGFASFSRNIRSPELLSRVLEEQGYLNAKKAHNAPIFPALDNWTSLPPQTQLSLQVREPITQGEANAFESPSIVYKLKTDFGEPVLSAIVTFPKILREAFTSVAGRIMADYLTIDTKNVMNTGELNGKKLIHIHTEQDVKNHKGQITGGLAVINAGGKVENLSGTIDPDDLFLKARDLISKTLVHREQSSHRISKKRSQTVSREYFDKTATIRSKKGHMYVELDNSLQIQGGLYESKGGMAFLSGGDQEIGSQEIHSNISTQGKKFSHHIQTVNHQKAQFKSGMSSYFVSEGKTIRKGVNHSSKGNTFIYSKGPHYAANVHDSWHESSQSKKKKSFGRKSNKSSQNGTITSIKNMTESDGNTIILSKENMHLVSPYVKSGGKTIIKSLEGVLTIEAGKSFHNYCKQRNKNSFVWQTAKNKGQSEITIENPYIAGKDGVEISGANGVHVELKGTLDQLQQEPGLTWIKDLRHNPHVHWTIIEEEHKKWNHKSQGLTAGGAAVIALAVAIATSGAGAGLAALVSTGLGSTLGAGASAVVGAMVQAGFQTLAQQATLSLINNQGDPLKTFKDLGSKQNIRSLATNMVVAAIVGTGGVPEGSGFVDHFTASALNNFVSNAAAIPLQNQDPKEALKQAIKSTVANTIQGYLAGKLGQNRGSMDFLSHKLAHSVLGAVVGAGLTKDWAEGAIAGGIGGLIAETIAESLPNNIDKDIRANIARMGTGAITLLTGQNVNVANIIADNALKHNFLKTADSKQDAQDVKKEKEEEEKKEEKKAKQEGKADKAVTSEDVKLHATKGKKETVPSSSTRGSDKKQFVKNNPQTAPPAQKAKNNTEKTAQRTEKATNKTSAPSKELAKATAAKPAKKPEKEKAQAVAKKATKFPSQSQPQTGTSSSNEPFEQIFSIGRPTLAERMGMTSYEETGATYRAIPQNKPSIQNVFNWGTEKRLWLEETESNYPRSTSLALQTVEMGVHAARGGMYAEACLVGTGYAAAITSETGGWGAPFGCAVGMAVAYIGELALGIAFNEAQQTTGNWAASYGMTPEEALNNRLTMDMGVGFATLPFLALTKGKGSSSLELLLTDQKLNRGILRVLPEATNKELKIHKNSLDYVGETHLYVIRDMETGIIQKYGESAMGKNRFGQSIRAESQVVKLQKETGKKFESEVIKEFSDKKSARISETKYIKTHRKVFGKNALPLNKTNR